MSEPLDLAASIRANTAAVQALTAIITTLRAPTVEFAAPKVDVAQARRDLQDAVAEDEAFAAIEKAKTTKPSPVESEVTLDDVKKAATALAKKDREMLAAILADHKTDKVSNLDPSKYTAFMQDVLRALS
jgi:hypothetical protein